jgi:DNA-binding response OmpR family regulator
MTHVHVIGADAAVLLAIRRVLERAGFVVTDQADEISTAPLRPTLVIADLPITSLAAIRRRFPMTRILAVSSEDFDPGEAHRLGGSLSKPFTPSQLLGAVRLCLARPGATKGRRQRSRQPRRRRI